MYKQRINLEIVVFVYTGAFICNTGWNLKAKFFKELI